MLDIQEVERAIAELEARDTTFASCAKLADLYAVRDHLVGNARQYEQARSYSSAVGEVLGRYGNSDFLRAVSGKDAAAVMDVMDELMDTLRVAYPRAYDGVMRKVGAA